MAEAAVNPSHTAGGLPRAGIEVEMADEVNPVPTFSSNGEPLWTQGMCSCICVATFDHEKLTRKRSLTHLRGEGRPSFFTALAAEISPHTTVIVGSGKTNGKWWFESVIVADIRAMLELAMRDAKKPTDNLQWLSLWTENDHQNGLLEGSFVIQGNGEYGRIKL